MYILRSLELCGRETDPTLKARNDLLIPPRNRVTFTQAQDYWSDRFFSTFFQTQWHNCTKRLFSKCARSYHEAQGTNFGAIFSILNRLLKWFFALGLKIVAVREELQRQTIFFHQWQVLHLLVADSVENHLFHSWTSSFYWLCPK